jgi:hypothetical protein
MNKTFAEYTTSTAFMLQLSKNQCNALLRVALTQPKRMRVVGSDGATRELEYLSLGLHHVGTYRPLASRGLVFWKLDEAGRPHGFGGLTRAGRLVVAMLKEAGLTIENTNTVSVLNRIGREERMAA